MLSLIILRWILHALFLRNSFLLFEFSKLYLITASKCKLSMDGIFWWIFELFFRSICLVFFVFFILKNECNFLDLWAWMFDAVLYWPFLGCGLPWRYGSLHRGHHHQGRTRIGAAAAGFQTERERPDRPHFHSGPQRPTFRGAGRLRRQHTLLPESHHLQSGRVQLALTRGIGRPSKVRCR